MVKLILVRHGETEENVAGILQGRMPGTLTEKGWQQIAALREMLARQQAHFDLMITSPLLRAVQTAVMLNATLHLPLKEEPLLQERDWGELTGHPVAEVRALKELPDSVETVGAMFLRASAFLKKTQEECDGKCVLAVTHGLFARCLQAAYHGVTIREIPPMANTETRLLEMGRGVCELKQNRRGFRQNGAVADVVSDK